MNWCCSELQSFDAMLANVGLGSVLVCDHPVNRALPWVDREIVELLGLNDSSSRPSSLWFLQVAMNGCNI